METKICNKCNIEMIVEAFPKRGKKGLHPYCRDCKKIYDREFYAKTKDKRRTQKKSNIREIRTRNSNFIWKYLEEHPCIDCGETDPIVLEFDHRSDKKYNVSEMGNLSIENVEKEIQKCDIRCANCHRRKTAKQFGWYEKISA
jgi:hypothetical protein